MTETLNKSVVLFKQNDEAVSIEYFDNKLIFTDGDSNYISTTIDRYSLLELAKKIKATVKDSVKAENFGADIGIALSKKVRKINGESFECFDALEAALSKLAAYEGDYRQAAIGGFAVTVLPLIRSNILPTGKCEDADADSEALVF